MEEHGAAAWRDRSRACCGLSNVAAAQSAHGYGWDLLEPLGRVYIRDRVMGPPVTVASENNRKTCLRHWGAGVLTVVPSPLSPGLPPPPALLLTMLCLTASHCFAPAEGRQPGDQSFRPNALQSSFPSTFGASTFSTTLAASTRFFASFSSTSFSESTTQVACVPGEGGTWPVPGTNCNMFYRCGSGRRPLEFRTCPPGKVYYAEYQDCQYPTASWRCWEPICTGRVDGLYPDWSTACRRSVRCQGGRVTAAVGCPAGQLSAGHAGCRPAHEVSCPRVSEGSAPVHLSPLRPAAPASAPGPAHPLCFGRSPSLSQDRSPGSRCRQYFRCSASGQRSVETCPGAQVFDGARCVEPEYYSCSVEGDSSPGSCDRLNDGAYPQPGSHCRAYYRCALGYKSVFVCSGDSVFDGERCVPNGLCVEDTGVASVLPQLTHQLPHLQQQLRLQAPETGICAGKSHGYFADTASGCRRYVYCLSGAPVGTFTCEAGRRFDGRLCVETDYCAGYPVGASLLPFQHQQQQFQLQQQQQQ
ncbi:Chitin-binding domain protein cbd-1, partial [Frankliniella fusca]